ncbi:hypothetical protein B1H19_18400 [Streptomyces gilvosporeus]|uniref:Uncharacterized protein n=1 Tax=Streptomyces gilvosporeus TaxID=553510 RepID=A0A1V0U3H2_9ACTN|nr:hypothetical protein B1H19_18400 [Streptomyces gilvosporeus]
MASAATAPPPISIQRLRREADSLSSASAAQSGVPDPPGPSNGPPCPKLMPRILTTVRARVGGAPVAPS